ncbi:MAG: SH3 domain-containing protein [Burkholderiaceae bacterium]|nr:SH3 domain-containing protein [Burkholderiaceae bacterium]
MDKDTTQTKGRAKDFTVKALCFLAVAFAALPATSFAQQLGYTSRVANLRAGPSQDYPVVATLPSGVSMTVVGCLSDYRWCDVVVGQYRGWVYAGSIVYPYQGRSVPLMTYGPSIGIGITAFSLGNYWDNYYRGYPWYPQRQRWINRPQPRSDYYGPGYGQHQPQTQAPRGGQHPPQNRAPNDGRVPAQRPAAPEPQGHPQDRFRTFER